MGEGRRDNAYGARRLGFGVSGPHGTPMIRPETTVRMVQHAYAMGVRIFDTGPSYGSGEAERRLGEALARLPPYDPIVLTKAGIQSSGLTKRHRDFSPAGIRRSVEASLKRLRRERIDWLFLHGPAPNEITDDLMKVLTDMRRRGDVVSIGVCGRGAELDVALKTGEFTHFMTPVHPGLSPEQMLRIYRLRSAGELLGIETLAAAMPRLSFPLSAGATWRVARSLVNGSGPRQSSTPMTIDEALLWALTDGGAHRVITTTSRLEHLEFNVNAVANPPSGRLLRDDPGLADA